MDTPPSPPLAHQAVLTLTGWPRAVPDGFVVAGVHVRSRWPVPAVPHRVTVRAYPHTNGRAELVHVTAFASNIRRAPAARPNGAALDVIGHLLKVDPGEGVIAVAVCPSVASTPPFRLTLHATTAALATDSGTHSVRVTGRILPVGPGLLLAETIHAVYAPIPERHAGWHGVKSRARSRARTGAAHA